MKSNTINKFDVLLRPTIKNENLVVSADNKCDNSECSKFWIDRGNMTIEVTDHYQELYYKSRAK